MRWHLTLILITCGFIVSVLIFQRGLLLKRQVIADRSKCTDVVAQDADTCWISARFRRAVILVVDGLRYDFIEPRVNATQSHYFRGQMPLAAQLLNASKAGTLTAKLFRFISDAPTTTFQRVKALITGNIPTFMEAGENFGASQIQEDNLIDQLVMMGKTLTFLGDDTWVQVLPERFHRQFALPSFDVKDLHTVDDLVIANIYDEIRRSDWDVLVAHVLGVDHCGHRYGVRHPEMRRKLAQVDELVHNLTRTIDDDTLLLVMGDHGMTDGGDHGGDSRVEVEAALLAYARRGFDDVGWDGGEVEQIDIVPTLSLLLGIPIPFSNLGRLIEPLVGRLHVGQSLKLNAAQVIRYAHQYAIIDAATALALHAVTHRLESAPSDADATLNRETIEGVRRVMRHAFQTNDMPMALVGLLSLVECVAFTALVMLSTTTSAGIDVSWSHLIFRSALLLLQLSLFFDAERDAPTSRRADLLTFNALTSVASLLYVFSTLGVWLCLRRTSTPLRHNAGQLVLGAVLLIQPFTFASNSFVVKEPAVLRFLFASFLMVSLASRLRDCRCASWRSTAAVPKRANSLTQLLLNNWRVCVDFAAAFCVIRLSALFESCREENADCNAEGEAILSWIVGGPAADAEINVGALFLMNYFISDWTIRLHSGREPSSLGRALTWPLCIGVALHWLCQLMEKNLTARGVSATIVSRYTVFGQVCAQIVYLAAFFFIAADSFISRRRGKKCSPALSQMIAIIMAMVLEEGPATIFCALILMYKILEPLIVDGDFITRSTFFYLFGSTTFYSLGHQCTFTAIPRSAAFVGLPGNFPVKAVAGTLIFIHMFAGNLLSIIGISSQSVDTERSGIDENFRKNALMFLFFNAFRVIGSCVACLFLWNNLMFFKIFAPKFVFEAINLLVCSVVIALFNCTTVSWITP